MLLEYVLVNLLAGQSKDIARRGQIQGIPELGLVLVASKPVLEVSAVPVLLPGVLVGCPGGPHQLRPGAVRVDP